MPATPVVAVITDEVSQDLDEVLAFMADHSVTRVDIRSVDDRNIILFDNDELARLADRLKAAGLTVGCYCSPLLKWTKPGMPVPAGTNFHGFDPNAMSHETAIVHAFEVANVLGAEQVRIFSYLAYPGFTPADLDDDLEVLLDLAEAHDVDLVLENEHVCNVTTFADIIAVTDHHPHPRLKAALDFANQISAGHPPPSEDEIVHAARLGGTVHVKDLNVDKVYVPVGQGVIDHAGSLRTILSAAPGGDLAIAVETHMPHDGPAATAASLDGLRRMLADIRNET
ncbi:MAG: TIM barrel protein [Thalassobaculaceae bacterium]|nr:TIM barrel protein [Thalassobaculaceae bacterium]